MQVGDYLNALYAIGNLLRDPSIIDPDLVVNIINYYKFHKIIRISEENDILDISIKLTAATTEHILIEKIEGRDKLKFATEKYRDILLKKIFNSVLRKSLYFFIKK